MPLEDSQYIDQLNPAWPLGTDGVNTSDDHHRNTKKAVLQSFPLVNKAVTASADDLNTLTGAALSGSGLNPTATILAGAFTSAPNGYLPCDGAAIPAEYTALIAIVGANTPDLRGQFLRGSNTGQVDPDGARAPLSAQAAEMLSHDHGYTGSDGNARPDGSGDNGNGVGDQFSFPRVTGLRPQGGNETRPLNVAVFYIIKW